MNRIIVIFCVTSMLLLSCSQKTEKVTSIAQIDGKRIGILTGSAGDLAARSAFPNSRFFDMLSAADAALALKTGKIDVFVFNKSVLMKIVARNPDLWILNQSVSKIELAIAVNKENTHLRSQLNEVLSALQQEGILLALKNKWVETSYDHAPEIPTVENDFANGTLRMGTCALAEPFTFQSEGKNTGFDIELAMVVGARLHKKIDIVDMKFDGLIPALQSGKIDLAISNFNVTDERKNAIGFSDPYISNDISVLVKK